MLEIPEALVMADQMSHALAGQTAIHVKAGASPHSFAWYFGEPSRYAPLLEGAHMLHASADGGIVTLCMSDHRFLTFQDGACIRLLRAEDKRPAKHQLLIELASGEALCVTIAMYGGLWAYRGDEWQSPYLCAAREKPSPLQSGFTPAYFETLRQSADGKLSLKGFLATEQRIPGLGNGVLQDVLFTAKLHPKRKLNTLRDAEAEALWRAVTDVTRQMTAQGGRDVERDLFGQSGGYVTRCSRLTAGKPCPICGTPIVKLAYMGGAVYFCPTCQAEK